MDKIILGYDFTENSESALNMALILAEKGNCALEIVWVDDTLDDTVQIAKETIRQRMDEMLRNIVSQNNQLLPNGRLVYSIAFGRVHDALIKKANFEDAALIVIGSRAHNGVETRFLSSTVFKITEKSDCPVLTIPQGYEPSTDFKHLIFPVDFVFSTRQKASMAAWFGEKFNSFVYILGLLTSSEEYHVEKVKEYACQVGRFLVTNQIEHEIIYRNTNNLAKTILSFAYESKSDMILIMTEQEKSLSNILKGSYTHQILATSTIPVLTLKPLNINTLDKENLGT